MRKVFAFCFFIITTPIVAITFLTATTYTQLGIAIFLYFILTYFALRSFPRKNWAVPVTIVKPTTETEIKLEAAPVSSNFENGVIKDIDKRAFLKMIGGMGISLFLFSIFNRRAEGLLFKSLPGSGTLTLEDIDGNKINPAERQPTDGYKISEIDDDVVTFYGFIDKDGGWLIMREDSDNGSFRYLKGDSDFPRYWADHKNLTYDYFHNVF